MEQSKSKLPPLPEDTIEEQYEEERSKKKKGKRRESKSYSSGEQPTPETESTPSNIPRRVFVETPTYLSPLNQEIPRQERFVVKIKEKNHNLKFNGEEVEKCIKKIERIARIEGETEEDLKMQMAFQTKDSKISDAIEAMPGYEEGNWKQLKKDLITK
ncbi:hypothetical protein O181_061971 [Austropuccinia psidii MF-1]|uniref:Uncharacterized protein n=1 Tax=Austropuccinia psidii MF-1 TaxID=1389203 RepID=A0A9Q3EH58_9BASI|nr:hypothetical protein [Austropuccinia psidii MF-1]